MKVAHFVFPLVALTGCIQSGSTPGDVAQQVVDGTRQLCSFVPLAANIMVLLGAPGAPAADALVVSICEEVKKAADAGFVAPGSQLTLTVNGQSVVGQIVN